MYRKPYNLGLLQTDLPLNHDISLAFLASDSYFTLIHNHFEIFPDFISASTFALPAMWTVDIQSLCGVDYSHIPNFKEELPWISGKVLDV